MTNCNDEQSITTVELDLSAVAPDDQALVQNVCAVMATLRKDIVVNDISITSAGQVYHVVAGFPKGMVVEVGKTEMDSIIDVNPLRVSSVSVLSDGTKASLKVRVCSMDHPVTITETSLVRVTKKRRWFTGLGW